MKKTLFTLLTCLATLAIAQEPKVNAVTVNQVAGHPKDHLGNVTITGVVAAVTPGKGFILVDKREYDACGISCLYEKGTNKVPVQWTGNAPRLESHVHVVGKLSESDKGLLFAAAELADAPVK